MALGRREFLKFVAGGAVLPFLPNFSSVPLNPALNPPLSLERGFQYQQDKHGNWHKCGKMKNGWNAYFLYGQKGVKCKVFSSMYLFGNGLNYNIGE